MSKTKQIYEQTAQKDREVVALDPQRESAVEGINLALATFMNQCPVVFKNTKGYGYKYADLTSIIKTINPIMEKLEMGFTQYMRDDSLVTEIYHIPTNTKKMSSLRIPQGVQLKGMNDFQVLGSAITYARRYSLSMMLGIVTDDDNDASGIQTNKSTFI